MVMKKLYIDVETRSAVDLPSRGSWQYARDETTRLLTVAWIADGIEHVWLPGVRGTVPPALAELHLPGVQVFTGVAIPVPLCRSARRLWIGHNSFTFDRLVWNECTDDPDWAKVQWGDTYPRALAAGLPGGLDKIGQFLFGEGKYDAGKAALKKASRATGLDDCEPENVPLGQTLLIAKYNLQDVRITKALDEFLGPETQEPDVLAAHDAINQRGWRVDRGLAHALIRLSEEAKDKAIAQIAELTKGALPDRAAVQSRARVLKWLDTQGFQFHSLKKDLVAKFLRDNGPEAEESAADEDDSAPTSLPLVHKVLELRMQALRITGGKLDSALHAMDWDDRARGLFVYWGAHTGRWAGRRIQVQNFPRPKDGIDPWALAKLYDESPERFNYDTIHSMLPIGDPLYPFLSVDDAASALLRMMMVPDEGKSLLTADLANIESRVLAWIAGEKWLMDLFWSGGDPYIPMAELIVQKKVADWPEYRDPKTGKPLPPKKHPYRQIVGKVPELAAGYQVGGAKLELYAAGMGHDLRAYGTTGKECVIAYRRSHPAICGAEAGEYKGTPYFRGGLWCQLNNAALTAVSTGGPCYAGKCVFTRESGSLIVTLPSGRHLTYRQARVESVQPTWAKGTDKTVEAVTYYSPRYGRKSQYGGAWAENLTQAIARDVLAYALVLLESAGFPVCGHCHDEAAASEQPERLPEFMRIMSTCPPWLTDFPLQVEGGYAPRYAKSPPPGQKDVVYRKGEPYNA